MKPDTGELLCALLLIPFFTQIILETAVSHIHDLGKSRTFLKKNRRNRPLWKRFLLIGYAQECKYFATQAKGLTIAYWAGFLWPIASMLCWALSEVFPSVLPVLYAAARVIVPAKLADRLVLGMMECVVLLNGSIGTIPEEHSEGKRNAELNGCI